MKKIDEVLAGRKTVCPPCNSCLYCNHWDKKWVYCDHTAVGAIPTMDTENCPHYHEETID